MAKAKTDTTETKAASPDSSMSALAVRGRKQEVLADIFTMPADDATGGDDLSGFNQVGMAPMIVPSKMPIGGAVRGYIVDATVSTKPNMKNPIITIELSQPEKVRGQRVAIPATAVIAYALGKSVEAILTKRNYEVIITKIGVGEAETDKKGKVSKHAPHLFRIFVSKEPRVEVDASTSLVHSSKKK